MKYIDKEEDSLIIYHLGEDCLPKTESHDWDIVREDVMIV